MANQSVNIKIKISYDTKKLINRLDKRIINETIEDYANLVKDETIQGLDISRDIWGRGFIGIQPVTEKIRKLRGHSGNKPLVASGAMKNSIKLTNASSKGKYRAKALRAESYGNKSKPNAHQQGFVTKNNPKIEGERFNFAGRRIPARPWFHNEESVGKSKRIGSGFDGVAREYFRKFNRAFTK